jgi:hypothetical protein
MDFYQKNFEFTLKSNTEFENKLDHYSQLYSFKKIKEDSNKFIFYKKWSLFDCWKTNPLNWKSKIEITQLENHKISVNYFVDGNAQITPIAFSSLFNNFILNFENYVNKNAAFKNDNDLRISLAKKRILNFFLLILLGAFVGLVVGFFMEKYIGHKFSAHFGIPLGAFISLKLLNNRLKEKYAM